MTPYGLFISYSGRHYRPILSALRDGVERRARPWTQRRQVRVFLDDREVGPSPALWSTIQRALKDSTTLLLVATPEASESAWVQREIEQWVQLGKPLPIILLLKGTILWDPGKEDFDETQTNCLPPAMFGLYDEEPVWLDLRSLTGPHLRQTPRPAQLRRRSDFKSTVDELTAAARHISKDALIGVAMKEATRRARIISGIAGLLAILVLVAVAFAAAFLQQRDTAVTRLRVMQSQSLADQAMSLISTDLRRALIIAAEAYRLSPTEAAHAALLRATSSGSGISRFMAFEDSVARMVDSPAGDLLVALQNGSVYKVSKDRAVASLLSLHGAPAAVATNAAGDVLCAAGGAELLLWRGSNTQTVSAPPLGVAPRALAISPSGQQIVEVFGANPSRVRVLQTATGTVVNEFNDPAGNTEQVAFHSEAQVTFVSASSTVRYDLRKRQIIALSSYYLGAHSEPLTASPDGEHVATGGPDADVRVWDTSRSRNIGILSDEEHGSGFAILPQQGRRGVAISRSGKFVAGADSQGLIISRVAPRRSLATNFEHQGEPVIGSPYADHVTFVGNDDIVATASDNVITLYDSSANRDRISQFIPLDLPTGCLACSAPKIKILNESQVVAVTSSRGQTYLSPMQATPGYALEARAPGRSIMGSGDVAWDDRGKSIILGLRDQDETQEVRLGHSEVRLRWVGSKLSAMTSVDSFSMLGEDILVSGSVHGTSGATGRLFRVRSVDGAVVNSVELPSRDVTFDPHGDRVLSYVDSGASIIDTNSGRTLGQINGDFHRPEAAGVFTSSGIVMLDASGTLQLWGNSGRELLVKYKGRFDPGAPISASEAGTLVAKTGDGVALLKISGEVSAQLRDGTRPAGHKTSLAISPDGAWLVRAYENWEMSPAGNQLGGLAITPLGAEHLLDVACKTANSTLTNAEWAALGLDTGELSEDSGCGRTTQTAGL